jgi:hypothetical protein
MSMRIEGSEGRTFSIPRHPEVSDIAAHIATEAGPLIEVRDLARAMALSFVARELGVSAIVSCEQQKVAALVEHGLLDEHASLSIGQALAMIGAYVRQRDDVILGGKPLMRQRRSEVYPLTARFAIPRGQEWWASCVRRIEHERLESLRLAEAVFKRFGQALRARDCVHEALRTLDGRAAILEALYHFDVALTSCVAALDALALVAHRTYHTTADERNVGWQKDKWTDELAAVAPQVASVVALGSVEGTALRLITSVRNSIHGIPLDEYLQAHVDAHAIVLEHRAMLSRALATRLARVGASIGPLERFGVHIPATGEPYVDVARFTEQILSWTLGIVSTLCGKMLATAAFPTGERISWHDLEQRQIEQCVSLCRIGDYPLGRFAGAKATPSAHARIASSIRRHLHAQRKMISHSWEEDS